MTSVLLYAQDGTASRDTVHFESIPSNGDRKVYEVLGAVSPSSIYHHLLSFSTHDDLKPKTPTTHTLSRLTQGFTFSTSITLPSWKGIKATLYWQQHTRESLPNPLATALLQRASSVRGDALLNITSIPHPHITTASVAPTSLSSIFTKLQALAAGQGLLTKILRQQHHRHHQDEVVHEQAATPPTPRHPRHHLNNYGTHHHHYQPKQQHHAAAGGDFGHDPRQKLLWSIAGQATSLSWEQPTPRPSSHKKEKKEEEEEEAGAELLIDGDDDDQVEEKKIDSVNDLHCPKRRHCTSSLATNDDSNTIPTTVPSHVEQQPAEIPLPAPHLPVLPSSVWTHVSPEVLGLIIAQQAYSSEFTRTISQVCKSWRMAVGRDKTTLSLLQFRSRLQVVLSPLYTRANTYTMTNSCSDSNNKKCQSVSLPWLVMEASKVGNAAATLSLARYLSSSSTGREDSFKYWARAAASGVGEGQFEMGSAHYRGVWGVPRDPEDALMWLSRFMKPYEEKEKDDHDIVIMGSLTTSSGEGAIAVVSEEGEGASSLAPTARTATTLFDEFDTKRVTEASLMLGYLHLDGECGTSDIGRALKWLKIAAELGCQEAARVIGSMMNTGQF